MRVEKNWFTDWLKVKVSFLLVTTCLCIKRNIYFAKGD